MKKLDWKLDAGGWVEVAQVELETLGGEEEYEDSATEGIESIGEGRKGEQGQQQQEREGLAKKQHEIFADDQGGGEEQ